MSGSSGLALDASESLERPTARQPHGEGRLDCIAIIPQYRLGDATMDIPSRAAGLPVKSDPKKERCLAAYVTGRAIANE
ncbi:hypothetical protein WG66_003631 [Moniliophthora roreri]|nr:hypothetical protein WG66_003631 [Moniliophthora roreri]